MKTVIAQLREREGWSQEVLAAKTGLRTATISNLENGKSNPRMSTLQAVADALGVHILDLFEDDRSDPAVRELIQRVKNLDEREAEAALVLLPRKPPRSE